MTTIQKISSFALGTLILFLLVFPAEGQTVKRVTFQKGQTSATFKGKLPLRYADYAAYVLRARKNQTLTVRLITDDPDASMTVFETKILGPGEDGITPEEPKPLRDWSGKLPLTSEYSVQIYGPGEFGKKGTGKTYTLEISVK
jgi:hypothetical protein